MKGLGRVVIGSAVGGLVGAAAFFAVDGLMPAKSAPINLICNETEITKNTHSIETAGQTSNPTPSSELWENIPVMIAPEQGSGNVWSTQYSLAVYPDRYVLKKEVMPPPSGIYPNKMELVSWTINRQTLTMEQKRYSSTQTKLMYGFGMQYSEVSRDSEGNCKVAPTPANNKI